jgi:hypothetical protein
VKIIFCYPTIVICGWNMDYEAVFKFAEQYLKKNDFGLSHTRRVFDIAKQNFEIPKDLEELVFCSIIMHDIGGSSIEKQYKDGPSIAASILNKLGYEKVLLKKFAKSCALIMITLRALLWLSRFCTILTSWLCSFLKNFLAMIHNQILIGTKS